MKAWIPLLMFAMTANAITIFVLFAPSAHTVFNNHPECSIAGFSPDLTSKQKAFCRDWSSRGQK
jgi:hypothetical protein